MTERQLKSLPFIQTGSGARALVFIHGLFDDGGFWRRTIQALETRYLALDLLTNAILPRFGRARITSISNASHWPHLEQPAATAKAIDGFLAEIGWSHAR